jgi:hypothetical protein
MKNLFWSALCIAFLAGCGDAGPKVPRPPVFPVHGVVKYNGEPVVGADVTFTSETANRSAFGRTDENGVYHLTTFSGNDGAVEGKQTVLIVKTLAATPSAPAASIDSPEYVPPGYETEPVAAEEPKAIIPAKYAKAETSGLIAVVNAENDNQIDFNLVD